jgi:hypothetical protein
MRMEVLTMRKWLNGKRQKLVLSVTLAVLVGSMAVLIGACEAAVPDPEMPEFEGTVLTDADIDQMVLHAQMFEDAGGAQNSTILLVHDFQEMAAVLVDALDASEDAGEIPLLMDVFYAYSLSLQEAAANLTYPDGMILFSTLDEENDIFGGNLGRIKQALCDWIITEHGAPATTQAEDVFVGITPELIQEVSDLLGITSGNLTALLEDIPPSERLTEEVAEAPGNLIVKPTGMSYTAVSLSWWKKIAKGAIRWGIIALSKVALIAKLPFLLIDYADAIIDCYFHFFPNWAMIENCLVHEHGLAPDVVERIIDAIVDP